MSRLQPSDSGMLPVNADGHRVYYERYGHGEPLLCLHGGPGSSLSVMQRYPELVESGFEVVMYDQLGGGRSDRPDDERLWVMDRFVDEVEQVRTGLGLGPVHLLGRSWGGMLGLQYVLDHPDAVRSFICSNSGASSASIWRSITRRRASLDDAVVARMLPFEAAGRYDDPGYADLYWEFTARWLRRSTPFDAGRSVAEAREVVAALDPVGPAYRAMWGPNEFLFTGNLIGWNVTERLGEITIPVLVVTGLHDEIDIDTHQQIVDGVADAEFAILGQSSHLIVLEKEADLYLDIIAGFLRRQRTTR